MYGKVDSRYFTLKKKKKEKEFIERFYAICKA